MSKILRSSLIAVALLGFFNVAGVSDAKGQVILREILNRMDRYNKALESFRSDVTMVKYNAQLGENDTYQGTTSYLPKTPRTKNVMYVRIDWTKPVEENIVVTGDRYKLYRPRLNQVIVGTTDRAKNSGSAGGALAFMSMSKEQLQSNYGVRYITKETISNGNETWHLELTPKNRTSYKSAELWVNADGFPIQAKIIEQNGDSTTVLLSNPKTNQTIKTDIFDLRLPKTVKEIKQ